LEKRDNEVYRSIFEATPLTDSARTKAIEKKKEIDKINLIKGDDLGDEIAKTLNNIKARMAYEVESYNAIEKLINNQETKLASIPAI
ncbi:MAG: M23 family peptidase, partial [Chitinophagaceae bacterium]|nr:M23 family peptidase [Chitinophagaceae bacterium]